jgi:hypothetical protein
LLGWSDADTRRIREYENTAIMERTDAHTQYEMGRKQALTIFLILNFCLRFSGGGFANQSLLRDSPPPFLHTSMSSFTGD